MKKASKSAKRTRRKAATAAEDVMRREYDFSGGVRGKYAGRFATGQPVRVVVLAPDVAEAFASTRAVNAALRRVLKERNEAVGSGRRSRRTA
jgi:hypothetical protein